MCGILDTGKYIWFVLVGCHGYMKTMEDKDIGIFRAMLVRLA